MNTFDALHIEPGRGICYSGFRQGQNPGGVYPSYQEIKQDLLLLQGRWDYLRLFDCDRHAETVLEVISKENLNFQLMLSAYITAEMNNFNCPWNGGVYSEERLEINRVHNQNRINRLIELANQHPGIVFFFVSWK